MTFSYVQQHFNWHKQMDKEWRQMQYGNSVFVLVKALGYHYTEVSGWHAV